MPWTARATGLLGTNTDRGAYHQCETPACVEEDQQKTVKRGAPPTPERLDNS